MAVSIALHKSLWSMPRNPAQRLEAKVINEFFLFLLMEFWVCHLPLLPLLKTVALNEATSHLCLGFTISVPSILRKFSHSLIWKHTLYYPVRGAQKQDSY